MFKTLEKRSEKVLWYTRRNQEGLTYQRIHSLRSQEYDLRLFQGDKVRDRMSNKF